MKKSVSFLPLPLLTAGLGGIALVLRLLVYRFGVDHKNLLVAGHPLCVALWVVCAAALAFIALQVWKLDGSADYPDNFSPSLADLIGHTAAAAGILITVLLNPPATAGHLGTAWKLLGFAAPVCLLLAGYLRMLGKQPLFLLHAAACLFFALHVVCHYQLWCSNPQLSDYVFALFGTIALCLFAFYCTAFDADTGSRRMQLFMGLSAAFLCITELAAASYPYLYLGCSLWALTGLCSLEPVPRKEPPKKE